jgi:hypothetical protein
MVLLIPPKPCLGDHKGHCLGYYIDSVVVVVQQNLSCIHTRRSFRKSILAVSILTLTQWENGKGKTSSMYQIRRSGRPEKQLD